MTHIDNIPHICQYGLTHRNSNNANQEYISIGDSSLISVRSSHILKNGKLLGDYIPLYFAYRTPMLYIIQNGYNGVKLRKAEEIIYCVTTVGEVLTSEVNFIFTDGHAIEKFSSEYPKDEVSNIEDILDMEAVNNKFWKNENDLDIKRRKEAEFLLASDLDGKHILGYICFNEVAKSKPISFGISNEKIAIRPNYYF